MTKKLWTTLIGKNFSLPDLGRLFLFITLLCVYSGKAQDDAGAVEIESLDSIGAVCPGSYPVKATIFNYGSTQVSTVTVNWSVDGTAQSPVTYNKLLDTAEGAGSQSGEVTLGNYAFASNQDHNIKVWTSMPNGNSDAESFNDTTTCVLRLSPVPVNLSISDITSSSVDISFNRALSTNYTIIYGTEGLDPDTGSVVSSVNTSPYILSGLSPETTYDIYITAECSGENSDTTGPLTFSTLCAPSSLPFSEDFDNGFGCFQKVDGGSTPDSWYPIPSNGFMGFYVNLQGINLDGTPYMAVLDNPGAFGGGGYFIEFDETIQSSYIDAGSIASDEYLLLEFDHIFFSMGIGPDFDSAIAEVYDGTQWQRVYSIVPNGSEKRIGDITTAGNPDHQLIDITNYANSDLRVRFTYAKGPNEVGIWAIDNVNIYATSCIRPLQVDISDITHQSIDIHLDDNITHFEYEIDTTDFVPGTGRIAGSATNNSTVSSLSPDMVYDLYVRKDCGSGDLSAWVGPIAFETRCALSEQLSGTYTIDAGQAAGGTNYTSFTDVCQDLNSCGISGPVVFEVASGTYNDSIVLNEILGVDSTNTITFRGNDRTTTELTTSSPSTAVIDLDGTDHVTIKNLSVVHTGTEMLIFGIFMHNAAYHNTIDSCDINVPLDDYNVMGIVAGNNLDGPSSNNDAAQYLTISNCDISGGESGVYLQGDDSGELGFSKGLVIKNNTFSKHEDQAVEVSDFMDIEVTGNFIDSLSGQYASAINLQYLKDFRILENKIIARYGMSIGGGNYEADVDSNSLVANNMIIASAGEGLLLNGVHHTNVLHNTVAGGVALTISEQENLIVKNNIFYTTTGLVIESDDLFSNGDTMDYNLYFSQVTPKFYIAGDSYDDLPEWQSVDAGNNVNSFEGDPLFADSTDLHVTGVLADGKGDLTEITTDIDGENRSATAPDLGADEYTPQGCPEVAAFHIDDQNLDGGTGGTFTFSFDRDGDDYNIEIGPCGYGQGTGTINVTGTSPLTVSGLDPNSCYDLYVRRACDTANNIISDWTGPFNFTTKCPDSLKLSGTYTINPGQASGDRNFSSFGDAISALGCGISGPVVFDVSPGTYSENVLLADIPGASADSTITFKGAGMGQTKLEYGSTQDVAVIDLNGADHISFKKMSIVNNSSGDAWGVLLQNRANHNTIDSCYIEIPETGMAGIATTDDLNNRLGYGNNATHLTVSNCTIRGGESGVSLCGSDSPNDTNNRGHIIENNVFRAQEDYALYNRYVNDIEFRSNNVDSAYSGMYMYYCNDYRILSNRMTVQGTGVHLNVGNNDVTLPERSAIVNNMILSREGSAMILSSFEETDVFHNTLFGYEPLRTSSSVNMNLRNNILYTENKPNSFQRFAYVSNSGSTGATINNNLYYSDDTVMFQIDGVSYSSLHEWRLAEPSHNAYSKVGKPFFVDTEEDLHLLYSQGAYENADGSVGVSVDIDGETRSSNPDIGADEFTPPSCLPPDGLEALNVYSDSIRFDWNPGNGTDYIMWYGPEGFMDNLNLPGTKLTGINSVPYTLTGLTPQTNYDVYVSDHCGSGDTSFWYGPVTIRTACTGQLSGVYTIDAGQATGGMNYNSFADVSRDLNDCGISSSVVFNIAQGTYNDHLALEEIDGVSAANTITFRGSGVGNTRLTSSSVQDTPTVYLFGADYVSFKNMTISNTNTNNAWGIFLGNASDYITIDSCMIDIPVAGTSNGIGIVTSSVLGFEGGGDNAHHLTVSNCTIKGGVTGIHLEGNYASVLANLGHVIEDNVFRQQNDVGIETDGVGEIRISGNDIDSLISPDANAMYLTDIDNFEISGNRMRAGGNAFFLEDGNYDLAVSENSEIFNNMILSESGYGMSLNDMEHTNVFYNSIHGFRAMLVDGHLNIDVRNNILYSSGNVSFVSFDTLGAGDNVDYNLYYSDSAIADIDDVTYNDLSAWQAADSSQNTNSIEGDPLFASAGDLHINRNSPAVNTGDNSLDITLDFDGETRPDPDSMLVDMGADEYILNCSISGDLTVTSIGCDSAVISWTPASASAFAILHYDTIGFSMENGNTIFSQSPVTIHGLEPGRDYEIYLSDTCATDTIQTAGPENFTTLPDTVDADYSFTVNPPTATDQTVDFDASVSTGASDYSWDFGDSTASGSGVMPSHSYTVDGTYYVELTVSGDCGTSLYTDTIVIEGISIPESLLEQSLELYPNPTQDMVQLSFKTQSSEEVTIRLTDLSGKVIRTMRADNFNGIYKKNLDLNYLAKGTYFLEIESGEFRVVRRIVKE